MKKWEGICERGKKSVALVLLHVYLFVGGDDNINVWKKSPPHALMEWDSKEEIKAGKEGVHDRSEFHQEVSILNLRNLRIILKYCALQWWAQMLIETKRMDGWGKGRGWEGPVNNCCVSVLVLWNLVFGPIINYDRGTCYP